MKHTFTPRIACSEWLPTGVMVHSERGESVLYSAQSLYDQRENPPNMIFDPDGSGLDDPTLEYGAVEGTERNEL